jgi:AraC-like DNA-binding protein
MTDVVPPNAITNAYRGPARGMRYEHWREEICRSSCNLYIGPTPGNDFVDVRTEITGVGPVTLITSHGHSADFDRSPELARDGSDDLVLVCGVEGQLSFHSRCETEVLGPSDMLVGELTDPLRAILGRSRSFSTFIIDRKTLLNASPAAEALISHRAHASDALKSMVERYAALAAEAAPHAGPHGRLAMGQHLVDLIALALGSVRDEAEQARQRGYAQARLALMKADALAELTREDLSIAVLARRYGLSVRQAQRLFEQEGTTFTEFVLERRFLLAQKLLADPANNARKISDIAYAAGFADISYFNRAFRRRFGGTPSDVRALQ